MTFIYPGKFVLPRSSLFAMVIRDITSAHRHLLGRYVEQFDHIHKNIDKGIRGIVYIFLHTPLLPMYTIRYVHTLTKIFTASGRVIDRFRYLSLSYICMVQTRSRSASHVYARISKPSQKVFV